MEHLPGDYVDITESDWRKFKVWPNKDFDQMTDLLVAAEAHHLAGGMPQVRLEEMRQSLGFKPGRESLLACPQFWDGVALCSAMRPATDRVMQLDSTEG